MEKTAFQKEEVISSEPITEVGSTSKYNRILGFVFFVVIILGFLALKLLHHKPQEKSAPEIKMNYSNTQNQIGEPTKIQNENKEINQLQEQLKLAKLTEEEKLYRLRQAAPIEMYSAKNNEANNFSDSSSSFSQPSSNLPLSKFEVSKLKSLLGTNVDSNTQFMNAKSHEGVEMSEASKIPHLNYTVTQGTLISGVLQTAINSDLPGMVKANVSMDVYSASNNQVLIPKGSILIGQYNSNLLMGQRRVFVIWTRLIRSDGVSILLGSPGTDSLGQSGLGADNLETHFWARFGQSSLLSIIGAGIANAGVNGGDEFNSASAYRFAIANNFQQSASSALLGTMNIKPTIHVFQGARINVFVNKDLSFFDVLSRNNHE